MNTFKTRLFGLVLVMFAMMSFSNGDQQGIKKNGEWIDAGMERIDGVWYFVTQCVDSNVVKCVVGTKKYKHAGMDALPIG